jgi:gliding motility-associated-like protein
MIGAAAQIPVLNPSFEGPLIQGHLPGPWHNICALTSTPDIQPGFLNVTTPAYDGDSYVQLLCRTDGTNEGIYQTLAPYTLTGAPVPGQVYYFQIWLAAFNPEGYRFRTPARLQVWLSASTQQPCTQKYLAWQSPPITHAEWQPYLVLMTVPAGMAYDIIQFESVHPDRDYVNGNVLLDGMSDSIFEAILPRLGPDTTLCEGQTLTLSLPDSLDQYVWQDGTRDQPFTVREAGLYQVRITLHGITYQDSIVVTYKPLPVPELGADTLICQGDQVTLRPGDAAAHQWQDLTLGDSLAVTGPGVYWVEANLDGCTAADTIQISYQDCESVLDMPNVFTPNGDGINEILTPIFAKNIYAPQLLLLDRWGRRVYQGTGLTWDGTDGTQPADAGVYMLHIQYQDILGQARAYRGTVTVLR